MARVIAQGDYRPMKGSQEAMDDLKRILSGRIALYSKADAVIDTSSKSIGQSFNELLEVLSGHI